MKKRIALDLHIAMFIFDIISCVQFTVNNYSRLLQLIMLFIILWSIS